MDEERDGGHLQVRERAKKRHLPRQGVCLPHRGRLGVGVPGEQACWAVCIRAAFRSVGTVDAVGGCVSVQNQQAVRLMGLARQRQLYEEEFGGKEDACEYERDGRANGFGPWGCAALDCW